MKPSELLCVELLASLPRQSPLACPDLFVVNSHNTLGSNLPAFSRASSWTSLALPLSCFSLSLPPLFSHIHLSAIEIERVMDEDTEERRRRPPRKSNFDVGPEEAGIVPPPAPATAVSQLQHYGGAGGVITIPYGGPDIPIRSLIEQRERDRIKRATEKNLQYIKRKIAEETERKFNLPGADDDGYYHGGGEPRAGGGKRAGGGGGGQKRSRAGIGAMPMGPVPGAPVGDVAVYVSNLPPDATWAQLDDLFSAFGTIRRIKLYRDEKGNPKGDALVTFAKPGSADAAVQKATGFVIAEGYAISVAKADFSLKEEGPHDGIGFHDTQHNMGQEEDEQADYEVLPPECEADRYPVVILRNVYVTADAEGDPDFYADLEADMLSECVKFGNVRRIVTPEGPYYEGSVAVVFERAGDAQTCAQSMHGRFFDGRQIEVEMQGNLDPSKVPQRILPGSGGGLVSQAYGDEDDNNNHTADSGGGGAAGDDVDEFFKSLQEQQG